MSESLRFAKYDLESSLDVARTVHERGGGEVSLDQLATLLRYASTNNGAFINRMAAARLFGLVNGRREVRATELSMRIIAPVYERDAGEARLESFLTVPLYRAFFEAHRGRQLPAIEGIRNALVSQFGVPPKQVARAAARMLDSAEQAGLFEIAGGRTRMVEPVIRAASTDRGENEGREEEAPSRTKLRDFAESSRPGFPPPLLEAALQELPDERKWNEEELREWLAWFEGALRIHFRLPRPRSRSPEVGNGGDHHPS